MGKYFIEEDLGKLSKHPVACQEVLNFIEEYEIKNNCIFVCYVPIDRTVVMQFERKA